MSLLAQLADIPKVLKGDLLEVKFRKELKQLREEILAHGGGNKCSVFCSPSKTGAPLVLIALNVDLEDGAVRIIPVMLEPKSTTVDRVLRRYGRQMYRLRPSDLRNESQRCILSCCPGTIIL